MVKSNLTIERSKQWEQGSKYMDEFKQERVNQVVTHGYRASEVAKRLGISTKSLYKWKKQFAKPLEFTAKIKHSFN